MPLLDDLNPAQRTAAATVEGPLLVLAGAGSGKTRVLTFRIAHLVHECGAYPWNILAVTFTNKAAGEMRERVQHLVGPLSSGIWIGTFHSICARLLRVEAASLGLDGRFTIYDEDDRRALMRRVLQLHQVDEKVLAVRAAIGTISRAKNAMQDPAAFAAEGAPQLRQLLAKIYATYQDELRKNNAFDFDDLLTEAVRRLEAHPEVLTRYQERFRYILVDEYQDTNRPQYLLCRLLAAGHRNLCVVGDDDQSIYQFRGADIRNILDFEKDYPDAKVVRLEQNYRSTGRILAAANAVIQRNEGRKGKQLWTESAPGDLIQVAQCDSDRAEARYIVRTLRSQIGAGHHTPGDAAILYRTNAQSRTLEEELQRSGLPYVIVGSIRFYERKEVKDVLAYLRLLANPADDVTLQRVINVPRRGIGDTSLARLRAHADSLGVSLMTALTALEDVPDLPTAARRSLGDFHGLMQELDAARANVGLAELGQLVYERSGYRAMLEEERTPEAEVRIQNVGQLVSFMSEFATENEEASLDSFLEEVALMAPTDETPAASNAVTLMTLHSAKGLEFPLVFMAGLEENLFPTLRAVEESRTNPHAIEEERRLCYVGITRARQQLHITYAAQRYAFGSLIVSKPSRFLHELPEELLLVHHEEDAEAGRAAERRRGRWNQQPEPVRRPGPRAAAANGPVAAPRKSGVHYEWDEVPTGSSGPAAPAAGAAADLSADGHDMLAVGRLVRHPKWGQGKILLREGSGESTKLTIQFGTQVKKVVAAYARLEPA